MDRFVDGHNHQHRHSGLGLHTPADVHYALPPAETKQRAEILATARAVNPSRFTIATTCDPKNLHLPTQTRITQPGQEETAA